MRIDGRLCRQNGLCEVSGRHERRRVLFAILVYAPVNYSSDENKDSFSRNNDTSLMSYVTNVVRVFGTRVAVH